MQSLFFLWLQLRMTQQYLREKTFDSGQSPADSASPNTPTGPVTLPPESIKQIPPMASAVESRLSSSLRQSLFRLLGSRDGKFAKNDSLNRRKVVRPSR